MGEALDEKTIAEALRSYIASEILDGDDEGLDSKTPLLEWGILNSMEMMRLLGFLESRFHVKIAAKDVSPASFRNIEEIAALVARQAVP